MKLKRCCLPLIERMMDVIRHCERSEAIHSTARRSTSWIASSQGLLAMTPRWPGFRAGSCTRRANQQLLSNHIFCFSENIYLADFGKSDCIPCHPVPLRGASATSRTLGWDAVDVAASGVKRDGRASLLVSNQQHADDRCCFVRQNRVVLAPVAGVKLSEASRPDRVRQSLNPATTVTRRIRRQGEHSISRQTIAREGRSVSAEPVCSCAQSSHKLHTRPRVQRAPGLPCALCILGAERYANLGRIAPRECTRMSEVRHCEEPTGRANARPMTGSATEAIQLPRGNGLLR